MNEQKLRVRKREARIRIPAQTHTARAAEIVNTFAAPLQHGQNN